MSLYTTAVAGLGPVGGLLAGLLADHLGAPYTLRLAGLACLAGSLAFALRVPRLNSLDHPDSFPAPVLEQREKEIILASSGPCPRS